MKRLAALLCLLSAPAMAQSNPSFITGQIPTAAQWNSYFGKKADVTGGTINSGVLNSVTINGSLGGSPTVGGVWTASNATLSGFAITGGSLSGTIAGTPTFSGTLSVNVSGNTALLGNAASSGANVRIQATAGSARQLQFSSGAGGTGVRWSLQANSTAEGGSNAGSDFVIQAENDTGTLVGSALTITRSDLHAVWGGYAQANKGFFANMGTVTAPVAGALLAAGTAGLFVNESLTGTIASGQQAFANGIVVLDTMDASASPDGAGRAFRLTHNLNAGFKGGRNSFDLSMLVQGASANANSTLYNTLLIGASANVNDGGVSNTNGNTKGGIFAFNPDCTLQSGATFWTGLTCGEIDVAIQSGASAFNKAGLYVTLLSTDANRGAGDDFGYGLTAQSGSAVGWTNGYSIGHVGGNTGSIIDPTNGAIFGITTAIYNSNGGPQFAKQKSKYGFNLSQWDATDSAWLSPGYRIANDGSVYLGGGKVSYTSPALSVDAPGQCVTVATVHAAGGGTGNYVGDYLYDATYHGQYTVATLAGVSPNAVATVTIKYPSCTTDVSPPTTLTMVGGSGGAQAIQLDVTWTAATGLQIGASVNTTIGTGAALATNATKGMLLIPSMAGTPTGNVGALGGVALNYDSTNKKLCVTIGAAVECTAAMLP